MDALYSFAEWIPCSQLFEHIIPVLFRILHATSRPVQLAACRALLWYTRKSSNSAHRHMNISKIKGDFAKGYSSWERLLYLEACQISLEFNSSKYVKQIFVDAAVELVMVCILKLYYYIHPRMHRIQFQTYGEVQFYCFQLGIR